MTIGHFSPAWSSGLVISAAILPYGPDISTLSGSTLASNVIAGITNANAAANRRLFMANYTQDPPNPEALETLREAQSGTRMLQKKCQNAVQDSGHHDASPSPE